MPISNVSGSNFTTLYSSYQGNTNPYVPIPPSNANVSGQNYTTLYSAGSGTAPVPIATYGNANVESFLAVGSDTGGNVVGNILSTGLISATGNIITDQYFIGTLLGNITGNFVVPGLNTQVIYNNNGNAAASSGLTFVAASNTLTSGGVVSAVGNVRGGNLTTVGQVSATGNITTANYFLGNGAFLTGLPAGYSNANVSAYLASGTNTSNIITTANIAGTYFLGNGSQLTGLPATYSNANVTTLLANFGSNVISTTGNITAGYFIGNGSALTSITAANITGTVANATYALNANAATYATNAIQANVANVANSVAGANVSGTVANAAYALNSNAATFAGTVTTAAQPNITSVGILTAINTSGAISATGNITGNVFSGNGAGLTNINAANIIGGYGNANVAANLAAFANNPISTSGNITAGYFIGNGAALTSLTGANVTGVVANATYALNANAATYATNAVQANYANIANAVAGANVSGIVGLAQYVTQNAQANITSVGTLTSLSVSGNINAGNVITSGTGLLVGNIFTEVANGPDIKPILTARMATDDTFRIAVGSQFGIADNGYVEFATADAGSEPIYVRQYSSANGDPFGTIVNSLVLLDTNGNTLMPGSLSAVGNITGNVFTGNGAGLTNIPGGNIVGGYGNANVAANLAAFATNPISTSGNITAGYFIGNGVALTSLTGANVTGTVANATYALNANSSSFANQANIADVANSVAGANVTGTVGLAQFVTQNAQANITSVGTLSSLSVSGNTTSGNISVVGNIDGSNLNISNNAVILGNLTVNGNTTFINSNVVTINDKFINLANNAATPSAANGGGIGIGPIASEYATLTYNSTANVWETNIGLGVNGNVTANYFIGNGSALSSITGGNVTGTVANATYALNANAATFAGTVTTNAQPNITSVGILTAINTSGDISATGNITGNVFTGNAAGLTNIPGGNVTGTVPLAQYVTQNAQANITSVGVLTALSVSGNITSGNITNNGTITSTGNITAPNFIGNVIGNIDAGGANTQVQFNDSDILNGTAGFTFDKTSNAVTISGNVTSANVSTAGLITATGNVTGGNVSTGGLITATGNVTGGNVITTGNVNGNNINATANIGSTQQTIIGTANTTASSTGNVVVSGKNIATDVVFAPDASTTTTPTGGRILIGTGVAGNTLLTAWDNNNQLRGTRVAIMDAYTKNNSSVAAGALKSWSAVTLDGNITATGPRIQGIGAVLNVGGGSAGNTYLPTQQGGVAAIGIAPVVSILNLGGANPNLVTQIGANVGAAYSTGYGTITQTYGSGTYVGNMQGFHTGFFTNNTVSNIRNLIGYSINAGDNAGNTTAVGNTIGFLFPGQTAGGTEGQYGAAVSGSFVKGNLYAFMNAGNLAQVRLGSTREQHYYAYPIPTTTGNVIVDASNGKVQTLTPTGNVTITDFTNFVNNAFNNALGTSIPQADDVTLIITQPELAPFYTVTLPTTLASTGFPVQYQNGLQTVAATTYAKTFVTIRSTPSGVSGVPWYVSVAASSGVLAAAGSNLEVQFNDANNMGANTNFIYDKVQNLLTAGNINVYQNTGNVWGNINAGNIFSIGASSLIYSSGQIQAAGNITGGNITSAGQVSAAGNITSAFNVKAADLRANTIYDNGAGNIGIITGNVNLNGNLYVSSDFNANTVSATTYVSTPNLYTSQVTPPSGGPLQTTTTLSTISGNLSVTGTITGTGNITGGNLFTSGSVSATGNVTAGNLIGTLITSSISVSGNVTAGNITTTGISNLGSLKTYNEAQYTLGSSGTINIDKNNGQVQYIAASGNVTIGSFSNFVTTQGGTSQADTVTVIIRQGSPTAYTITMPTGNASIKYAANLTTVGTAANSVTLFSVTAANVASVPLYLITISPEFI
jgi:hypothetical protein